MGFRGVESEAEEDRGGDRAGGLILNQHTDPIVQSHVRAPEVEQCQPEEDRGKDKAGGLILNQYGVRGACINLKKAEARTRPEGVSSTNTGSGGRGLSLKRAEARTRPEGLSSTNIGSEVRGLSLKRAEAGGGKDKTGGLILNQYGFLRCVV